MTQRIYQSPILAELPPVASGNLWDTLLQNMTAERTTSKDNIFIDSDTGAGINMPSMLERLGNLARALHQHPRLSNARTATETKDLQTIGIFSLTHIDYPTVVYSALASGIPFAPMASSSTKSEAEHLFRLSHAKLLFVHPTLLPRALEAGYPKDQIVLMESTKNWHGETVESLVEKGKRAPDFRKDGKHPVPACELTHILFSSGSTGQPKGVMLTHTNVKAALMQIAVTAMIAAAAVQKTGGQLTFNPGEQSIMLANLPMYHTYGLMGYILRPMLLPTVVILFHKWNIAKALKTIEKYKVTNLTLVPALVTQFLSASELVNKADLSSVRNAVVGAAAISSEPKRRFIELIAGRGAFRGIVKESDMGNGYGMSEATVSITGWPVEGMACGGPRTGTVGCLLPSYQARLVKTDWTEPEGVDVAEGESGEMLLKGPTIMKGYLDNPEATKKTFTPGGWFKTGDELRIEADGQVFYVDRLGDVFKTNGLQVAPSEITTLIRHSLPEVVSDCVVAGMPAAPSRAQKGNEAWAFVVLTASAAKQDPKKVEAMIKKVVKDNLAKHKWVEEVRFLDEFPLGPTGKVLAKQIKADALKEMSKGQKAKL